jgi:hypothetical protein
MYCKYLPLSTLGSTLRRYFAQKAEAEAERAAAGPSSLGQDSDNENELWGVFVCENIKKRKKHTTHHTPHQLQHVEATQLQLQKEIPAMPRPFPLPITVGTDICPIARIRRVTLPYEGSALRIQKAAGVGRRTQRFVSRILGEREREQLPRYATAYLEDVSREWKEIRRLDGLIGRSRRRSREEAGEMGMLKPVELGFERDGSILSSVGSEKHISTEASIEEEYALEEIARTEEDELPDLEMGGFELSELERLLDEKLNQTSLKSQRFFEFLAGRQVLPLYYPSVSSPTWLG